MDQSAPENASDRTLAAQVFERLHQDLKANRFKPGERLRFETMRSLYDVGVAPLREALSRLTEAGLVVQAGQKGFRVAEATLHDLHDVVETRRLLEVKAFQEAVRHGNETWESEVVASFHRFSKVARSKPSSVSERALWEERHTAFHNTLIAGCPSRLLRQFWSVAYDRAERYRRLAIEVGHWSDDELGDHEQLVNAVIERDEKKAGELLHRHIGSSADRLLKHIGPVLSPSLAKRRPRDTGNGR